MAAISGDMTSMLLVVGAFAAVGWFLLLVIVLQQRKNPYIKALVTAERKNIPIVLFYKVSNRMNMMLPKRNKVANSDQKDNTLELPQHYGTKFVPPVGKDCNLGKTKIFHYFSKLSIPLTPVEAAALTQFNDFLGKYGLKNNDNMIDALIRCNLDPEKMLPGQLEELPYPIDVPKKEISPEEKLILNDIDTEYANAEEEINQLELHKLELKKQYQSITGQIDPITEEEIITLRGIQKELKKLIVQDDFFVWNIAEKFAQVYSGLQAKELDEIKSTFAANSMLQNFIPNDKKNMKEWAFLVIIAIIALAALKTIMS